MDGCSDVDAAVRLPNAPAASKSNPADVLETGNTFLYLNSAAVRSEKLHSCSFGDFGVGKAASAAKVVQLPFVEKRSFSAKSTTRQEADGACNSQANRRTHRLRGEAYAASCCCWYCRLHVCCSWFAL